MELGLELRNKLVLNRSNRFSCGTNQPKHWTTRLLHKQQLSK
jgi:hypothetical protein